MQQLQQQYNQLAAAQQGQSTTAGDGNEPDEYDSYSNEGINFQKDLLADDVKKDMAKLIDAARLDQDCRTRLKKIYAMHVSKDNVLTKSTSRDLERRTNELLLTLSELERSIDPVNFIFSDYEIIVSEMTSRVAGRNTRGHLGFEKITSQTSFINRLERVGLDRQPEPESEGWGFNRLFPRRRD